MEKQVFILSKEEYLLDMITTRFVVEETDMLFDPDTNPEHQKFVDFYYSILENNKHVIDFDDDTVFIVGCSYDLARSMFGSTVGDTLSTKKIITEMLMERFNARDVDYYALVESIYFNKEFKTKEDIESWMIEKESLINDIKISNWCEQLDIQR